MRLVFNFKMSAEDYHHMLMCRTFGNSWYRRMLLIGTWTVFALLLISDLTHVMQLSRVVHLCALMVTVALPAAFLTVEINAYNYRQSYQAGFQAERRIVADDEGLTFCNRTTDESGTNTWREVTKLEEMEQIFVISLNRCEAVILPKRGMGNGKRIEQFRQLANQKIPGRFYPLKKNKNRTVL